MSAVGLRLLALLLSVLVSGIPVAVADWHRHEFDVMGTRASVELWHEQPERARQAMQAVEAEMRRIDAAMSPWKPDSELSRVNRSAAQVAVPVSVELFTLIATANKFSELTQGAFDITFSSVGYLYDYRAGKRPDVTQIERRLPAVNFRLIELIRDPQPAIRFQREGMRIDLGGIAKGHAVDRCIELLRGMGITHAYVNAGGDTRVLGDRRGRLWFVAVRHPRDASRQLVTLPISDIALSTSGDYERFFDDEQGVRHHHIINPQTGDSARKSRSVTILAPDSTTADALSTSVFILGAEAGLSLLKSMPDVSAVIVDQDGKVHYTDDLVPRSVPAR